MFDCFPPLVSCSTFSYCSNKCCHSGNLACGDAHMMSILVLQKTWQNKKGTTKASKADCCFYFFWMPITITTAAKTQWKQATTNATATNMLWPMPQRLIVVILCVCVITAMQWAVLMFLQHMHTKSWSALLILKMGKYKWVRGWFVYWEASRKHTHFM